MLSDVSLSFYTDTVFNFFPPEETPDPLFKEHIVKGWKACYDMAYGVSEEYLKVKGGAAYENFGRPLVFWECANVSILYFSTADLNQKLLIQMAISLKICISDPKLVKAKCVLEAYTYFENCKQTAENLK